MKKDWVIFSNMGKTCKILKKMALFTTHYSTIKNKEQNAELELNRNIMKSRARDEEGMGTKLDEAESSGAQVCMVFCYPNYSDLAGEKIVLVIEKNF